MRPAQPILGKEKDVDSGKTELPQVSESPVCLPIQILPFFFFVEMNTSIRNALQREAAVEVTVGVERNRKQRNPVNSITS